MGNMPINTLDTRLLIVFETVILSGPCAGAEGNAGMAAVAHPGGHFDLDRFSAGVREVLPSYARPLFLRLVPYVDTTGEWRQFQRWAETCPGNETPPTPDHVHLFLSLRHL